MLATLRVRVYGNAPAGSGYVESVDGVSLAVNYTPYPGATVTMSSALAVTTAIPAPLVNQLVASPLAVTVSFPAPTVTVPAIAQIEDESASYVLDEGGATVYDESYSGAASATVTMGSALVVTSTQPAPAVSVGTNLTFRAAGAANSGASQVTSFTGLSLSASLQVGDVVYVCISSESTSSVSDTFGISGGGVTTWTPVGTQPARTGNATKSYVSAQTFMGVVTSAGGGAVTCTCTAANDYMMAAYWAGYNQAATPTDVYPTPLTYGASSSGYTSFAAPSGTTTSAGDFYVTFLAGNFSTGGPGSYTPPSGTTLRASSNGADGQLIGAADTETPFGASSPFGGAAWGYSVASVGIVFSIAVSTVTTALNVTVTLGSALAVSGTRPAPAVSGSALVAQPPP